MIPLLRVPKIDRRRFWGGLAISVLPMLAMLGISLIGWWTVELACTRDAPLHGTCTATSAIAGIALDRTTLPLADIAIVDVDEQRRDSERGTSTDYTLELRAADHHLLWSHDTGPHVDAGVIAAELRAFRAADGAGRAAWTIRASWWQGGVITAMFVLPLVLLSLLFVRRVEVFLDEPARATADDDGPYRTRGAGDDDRVLVVRMTRWPLRPRERRVAFADVLGVRAFETRTRVGVIWSIELATEGGPLSLELLYGKHAPVFAMRDALERAIADARRVITA